MTRDVVAEQEMGATQREAAEHSYPIVAQTHDGTPIYGAPRYVEVDGYVVYPASWDRRASLEPFLAWLLVAFICGVLITLALSAATSAADRVRFRTPASMAVSGVAAVRVIVMDPRTSEDPSPASAAEALGSTGPSLPSFTTTARDDPARILANIVIQSAHEPGRAA